jgi:thiol-disulfide isomerase/thioredoxin
MQRRSAHRTIALCLLAGAVHAQSGTASSTPRHDPSEDQRTARARAHEAQMLADQTDHPTLAIGADAPGFALPGIDGKTHALVDFKASPILAIVFISNHCPASQLYEGRIKELVKDYADKGVRVVAIAPNGPAAIGPRH